MNNAWIVGIIGGILSGLFVTYISRYLFSKRDSREYAQKTEAVNREVIYSLKSGISENNLPSQEILSSVIAATCRKYKVNEADVLDSGGIAEELIKEVMDSSFIASATKLEYCNKLMELKSPGLKSKEPLSKKIAEERLSSRTISRDIRDRLLKQTSMVLGIIVALMTAILTIVVSLKDSMLKNDLDKTLFDDKSLSIPIIISIIAVSSLILTFILRDLKHMFFPTESDEENFDLKVISLSNKNLMKRRNEINIKDSLHKTKDFDKDKSEQK